MGRDKADTRIGSRTMLEMVADALAEVTDRVVVLGPERNGWECWPDSVHVRGPLAGVATALGRTDRDRVLAVAVDQPFVRPETLRGILDRAGELPVVPVDEQGTRQVTCASYPRSIAPEAADEAALSGSIQTLLDRVAFLPVTPEQWRAWGEDGRSWFSIDTEKALDEAIERFGT